MIVDSHSHIFRAIRGRIGSGPTRGIGYGQVMVGKKVEQILPPCNVETTYTVEMLLANLDWAGIDRAVILQGPFYGEVNQYTAEAIRRYPHKLLGAAYLDPWDPGSKEMLAWVIDSKVFSAVKLECSEATGFCGLYPEARLDDPDLDWVWLGLCRQEIVLILDLGAIGSRSYQTEAVRSIALQYPDLKIVIAHLAQPRPEAEGNPLAWQRWLDQIDLGTLPNVWFDCAALPAYLPGEDYPFPTVGRYLRLAIERLGPSKILWGTDQPGLLIHANLLQMVKMAQFHTSFLSSRDQALVLGGNAIKVFTTIKGAEI